MKLSTTVAPWKAFFSFLLTLKSSFCAASPPRYLESVGSSRQSLLKVQMSPNIWPCCSRCPFGLHFSPFPQVLPRLLLATKRIFGLLILFRRLPCDHDAPQASLMAANFLSLFLIPRILELLRRPFSTPPNRPCSGLAPASLLKITNASQGSGSGLI